jgi:hypothetical protein
LGDFTWGQLRDVELLVGVTDVTIAGDHLVVDHSEDGFDTESVVAEDEALEHVNLGATDFIITVFLIPDSDLLQIINHFR